MAKSKERGGMPDFHKHPNASELTGWHQEMNVPVPRRGSSTPPKHETGDQKRYTN